MKKAIDELSSREPYFDELTLVEQIEQLRKTVEYLCAREYRLTNLIGELSAKLREHEHSRSGKVVIPIDRVNYPESCGRPVSNRLKLSK